MNRDNIKKKIEVKIEMFTGIIIIIIIIITMSSKVVFWWVHNREIFIIKQKEYWIE